MAAYLAQGQSLQVKPLDQVFQVAGRPLVGPEHLRLEEGHPIPRDPEGQWAVGGVQDPLVIPVPIYFLPVWGGRREEEVLDLALQGLVEGPFELRPDERIQIVAEHRRGLLGRHRRE